MELNHIQENNQILKNDLNTYKKNNINTASSSFSFIVTGVKYRVSKGIKSTKYNVKFQFMKIILKDLFSAIKFPEIKYLKILQLNTRIKLSYLLRHLKILTKREVI